MAKKEKIQFLNHDVRNSIGVALGYAELLLKFPEIENSHYLQKIMSSLLRASEISLELGKEASELDSNCGPIIPDTLQVVSVQKHFEQNLIPAFDALKRQFDIVIDLNISAIPEEKYIRVDPSSLKRARENIIANAINAGATAIDVSYQMMEHCLVVTFKDNGEGMTKEQLERLQLLELGDGIIHGLGSKSIYDIAKSHKMPITYDSTPGSGTCVKALVPYYRQHNQYKAC